MCDEKWRMDRIVDSPDVDSLLRENLVIVVGEALAALTGRDPGLARRVADHLALYAFGTKSCDEYRVFTTLVRALHAWALYLEGEVERACRLVSRLTGAVGLVRALLGGEAAFYLERLPRIIGCV